MNLAMMPVRGSPGSRPRSGHVVDKVEEEEEKVMLLCSKSGMGLFRRFLEGKSGEKNWLFWLDAEQTKQLELQDPSHLYR